MYKKGGAWARIGSKTKLRIDEYLILDFMCLKTKILYFSRQDDAGMGKGLLYSLLKMEAEEGVLGRKIGAGEKYRRAKLKQKYMHIVWMLIALVNFGCLPDGQAQWTDSFDSVLDASWQGTREFFRVEEGFLRSQGPEKSSTLYLSREFFPLSASDMAYYQDFIMGDSALCLEFGIDLGFVPSSTNLLRLYLFSREAALNDSAYAYYLQMGQKGSENYWQLYRSSPDTTILLWQGRKLYSKQKDMRFRFRVLCRAADQDIVAGLDGDMSDARFAAEADWLAMQGGETGSGMRGKSGTSLFRPLCLRFYSAAGLEGETSWESDGDSVLEDVLGYVLESPMDRFSVGLMARYRTASRSALYAFDYLHAGRILYWPESEGDSLPPGGFMAFPVPDSASLKITEVMFNPLPDQSRFVEIGNVSDSVLGVRGLHLGIPYEEGWRYYALSRDSGMGIWPGSYLAVAKEARKVAPQSSACRENIFTAEAFPSLDDKAGRLRLAWIEEVAAAEGDTSVLDEVVYDEAFHHWLLPDPEGVSLERLDVDASGLLAENWMSAAETSGYATPGCENSHAWNGDAAEKEEDWFTVEPPLVTPDNDGLNDFATIGWNPALSGFLCSITVYDEWGRKMCSLCTEMLLGSRGSLRYDAVDATGRILRPGLYIIYIDLLRPDGKRKRLRYPLAVG